jgi:hypothetical protein
MPNINIAGPTIILNSTSTGPGSWYKTMPGMRNQTVQATFSATGASTTISGVCNIEVSNDGATACGTLAGAITSPNNLVTAADGFAMTAHWEYMRANLQSLSTGICTVTVSAGHHGV